MWVARNKDGELWLFDNKPERFLDDIWTETLWNRSNSKHIDDKLFPELTWNDNPIEVELKALVQNQKDSADDLDDIFKKLSETHNIDEAYELCKNLKNKCFRKTNKNNHIVYMKLYDVYKYDEYVIASRNYAYIDDSSGTFCNENKYVFSCKDESEFIIWSSGKLGPFKTYDDLVMTEISNEEFVESVKRLFEEYMKTEIE